MMYRKTLFAVFFVVIFGLAASKPVFAEGRYFVKSNRGFWKNTLGVRHIFENGFSAELNDFQIGFAQMFGIELEHLPSFQILVEPEQPLKLNSDTKIFRQSPQQQYSGANWGFALMLPSGVTATNAGVGVTVAILDTGIDSTHPDLIRRITVCKDFSNPRFPVVNGKCEDKNGHGTHVAGIIAADGGTNELGLTGMAPGASLLVYKVCGSNGSCAADDVAAGIRAAADANAMLISMNFGSDTNSGLIANAVRYAAAKNSLIIAAAGNDGPFSASIDYPAAYREVIGVGAITQKLNVAAWSSRGNNDITPLLTIEDKDIEHIAPGEGIESTWLNGAYATLSGTSMAASFVTGMAARMWQSDSDTPVKDTRAVLHRLAGNANVSDPATGYGIPNLK